MNCLSIKTNKHKSVPISSQSSGESDTFINSFSFFFLFLSKMEFLPPLLVEKTVPPDFHKDGGGWGMKMMRMDPLGCEEMEMMGEDQEAVGWLRPEQHSSVWNSLNKKPACTKRAEQSLIHPLQQFTCVSHYN